MLLTIFSPTPTDKMFAPGLKRRSQSWAFFEDLWKMFFYTYFLSAKYILCILISRKGALEQHSYVEPYMLKWLLFTIICMKLLFHYSPRLSQPFLVNFLPQGLWHHQWEITTNVQEGEDEENMEELTNDIQSNGNILMILKIVLSLKTSQS